MKNIKLGGLRLLYKTFIDFVSICGHDLIVAMVFILSIVLVYVAFVLTIVLGFVRG